MRSRDEPEQQAHRANRANLRGMTVAVWRVFAFLAAVAIAIGVIAAFFTLPVHGDLGYDAVPVPHDPQSRSRVVSVDRRGPAAGLLRKGDLVRLADSSTRERSIYLAKKPGTIVQLRVDRAREAFVVPIRVYDRGETPSGMLLSGTYLVIALAFASLAVLIVLRATETVEARSLANFFLSYAASIVVASIGTIVSWQVFTAAQILSIVLLLYGFTEAARFSTLFPTPATGGFRARFRRILRPMFAAGLLLTVPAVTVFPTQRTLQVWYAAAMIAWWVIMVVGLTTSFAIAARTTSGVDAQRIRWAGLSIAVGFSGLVATIALQVAGIRSGLPEVLPLTLVAIPLGMTYAILRHRLIDIGFVINRALVFGIVSGIVVLAFGILEFILGRYLLEFGHVTSTSLELGLALGLGFSLRYIHRRTERLVDDLVFRERHRAEAELRRFAREAVFFTDVRALRRRSVEVVERWMQVAGAVLIVPSPAGRRYVAAASTLAVPSAFDPDDPALVALRASSQPFHLRGSGSELPGEIAFAGHVRNELVAALVCGAKRDGDVFAPDETEVLEEVAREVAVALDALEIAALRREVARVVRGEGSLQDLARAWRPADAGEKDALPATGGASQRLLE